MLDVFISFIVNEGKTPSLTLISLTKLIVYATGLVGYVMHRDEL